MNYDNEQLATLFSEQVSALKAEVARQSKAMVILDEQVGRWQDRTAAAEAEVARLKAELAAARERLDRGVNVVNSLLAVIGEAVSQFHAAEADERLPAEVRKVVGGWAVLLAKALTLDRAALAKPEQECAGPFVDIMDCPKHRGDVLRAKPEQEGGG